MQGPGGLNDDAWRTATFRQSMVNKIEEAISNAGASNTISSVDMENQVYGKAKTKDDYLGYVAKLIIHIKDRGKAKAGGIQTGPPGPPMSQQTLNPNFIQQPQQHQLIHQPNIMVPRGMGPGQGNLGIMGPGPNRLMAQPGSNPPNMASQLTQMAQQQQQRKMLDQSASQFGPGGTMTRPPQMGTPGQFIPPQMGAGAAAQSPGPQGSYPHAGTSPGPGMVHLAHSPASSASSGLRPYMVPSPGASLNTPAMMAVPTPSPRNAEDVACMEKIKELRKYTDLLQRAIAKIGNDDLDKSSKMKKLLEILTNPNQRVSMELLLKCESALKKMERTDAAGGVGGPASVPQPTSVKEQTSPFTQFYEAVQNMSKFPTAGHTWRRTVQPVMDSFFGHSLTLDELPDEDSETEEPRRKQGWVLEKELNVLNPTRFRLHQTKPYGRNGVTKLRCMLIDKSLPTIPSLKLIVPLDYPDQSPKLLGFAKDYGSTELLRKVGIRLKCQLLHLSTRHTLTELLNAWEMSVRQECSPEPPKVLSHHPHDPLSFINLK